MQNATQRELITGVSLTLTGFEWFIHYFQRTAMLEVAMAAALLVEQWQEYSQKHPEKIPSKPVV